MSFQYRVRIQPHEYQSNFALFSAMPFNSSRFASLRCLSAPHSVILSHVDQVVGLTLTLHSGKAKGSLLSVSGNKSRSHLPMSAAPVLMSDRTQRNVRARFQDTQRIPPGNLDLTFGKDLRRKRGFHATQIFYRLDGNTLMSRQELDGPAG